jgi:hypothetical protein
MATFSTRYWGQYTEGGETWKQWFARLIVGELDRKGRAGEDIEATVTVGTKAFQISTITSGEWYTTLGIDEHNGDLIIEYGFITNAIDLTTPEIFYLVVIPKTPGSFLFD